MHFTCILHAYHGGQVSAENRLGDGMPLTCSGCNVLRRRQAKLLYRLSSRSVQTSQKTGHSWSSYLGGSFESTKGNAEQAAGGVRSGSCDERRQQLHEQVKVQGLQPGWAQRKRCRSSRESLTWRRMLLSNPGPTVSPAWTGTTVVLPSGCRRK